VLHARGRRVDRFDAEVAAMIDDVALAITEREGGVRFGVHAKPRASKSKVLDVRDGVLRVALAAPPIDGEANAELARVLADALGVAARDVTIVAGQTGKRKIVEVRGIDAALARRRFAGV
jgi:uncharacterized protein (TIGR00251 family)